jgi:hypothetical protein
LIKAAAATLISAALGAAPAAAQQQVDVPQITTSRAVVAPAEPVGEKGAQPVQQLSTGDDSRPAERQVNPSGSSNEQPSQVATRTRNPQPPQPLSTPEQGRTAAIDPVHGHDRCDPADEKQSKTLQCRKVIENRAAEYVRPSPTRLSPEQKLMVDQQLQARVEAARRLANSGQVDGSIEGMGIASIVLDQSTKQNEPEKKPPEAQSDAAVQAIMTILNQAPPQ